MELILIALIQVLDIYEYEHMYTADLEDTVELVEELGVKEKIYYTKVGGWECR